MNLRLELVTVPVSDVDRAKAFYVDQVGFTIEQDVRVDEEHRFVELMPPGSPCSIALTTGYVDSQPGSLEGIQVNVDDVEEVHAFLRDRGVDVSEIQEYPWGRFCFISDPDGTAGRSTNRRARPERGVERGHVRMAGRELEPVRTASRSRAWTPLSRADGETRTRTGDTSWPRGCWEPWPNWGPTRADEGYVQQPDHQGRGDGRGT
jgi:predicted enzyme related to lactoylglutathione lyase